MDKSAERIVDIDVAAEMRESFLEYSYSVIYSRALPDARDGLKPVQRRIVYQMGEMGLRPDRGHVKSARVTGEVMGKLHPHGDSAIYDALVRMSQPFSLRLPLIDGHGNFGSLDDGPAAARYTEARLAPAALLLNESLDEDTVDFIPNYDAQLTEPEVLPAAFPNLLVNGASGIAVGMATNMAPHNLGEVIQALLLLLRDPTATLEKIMECLPGPDLPSGGQVLVADGLRDAYSTGRGSFKMRAKISVESVAPRRTGLVVTELPYLVGPERVIDKIRDAVNSKKLEGIHNVVDLTDRDNGLKLIIELKSGIDPSSAIEALYRLTPLEENFGINNVALVEGRPQQLGLIELLNVYLEHRVEVTTRRSNNRLDKRQSRLHLIDGLQVAVLNIDEVIELIRTSDTAEDAKKRLRTVFDFSDQQADYILELRLRRLTKFSIIELEQEADQLRKEIAELREILGSKERLEGLIAAELQKVANEHPSPRRTELVDASGITVSRKPIQVAQISDDPAFAGLTPTGRLYRSAERLEGSVPTSLRADVALVLSDGTAHRVHVADLPQHPDAQPAQSFLGTSAEVLGVFPWASEATFAMGTAQGVVKRIQGPMPDRDEASLISLKEGDQLVGFGKAEDKNLLCFVTSDCNFLAFEAQQVRPQGLPASGMTGIKVDSSKVVGFGVAGDNAMLVSATNSSLSLGATDPGSAKITPVSAYPTKGRGTMGVRCQRFLKGEDQLYFAAITTDSPTLYDGAEMEIPAPDVDERRDASGKPLASYVQSAG